MSKLVFVFLVSFVFAMAMAQPVQNDNTIDVPIEGQKVVLQESQPQLFTGRPTLGQIIDRVGDAAHLTIAEERQIIRRALSSLREATGASLRASIDAAHAGLDFFLVVPRFGTKLFGNTL